MQYYAEILRSVAWRDNNGKPLASNDPSISTTSWSYGGGSTVTSDGDVITINGTQSGTGVLENCPALSTNTYPYSVTRLRCSAGGSIKALIPGTPTFNLTSNWQTFTYQMPAGFTLQPVEFYYQTQPLNLSNR